MQKQGKILVVDDERFNCDIIESFFQILGLPNSKNRLVAVQSGEAAINAVQAALDDCDPYRFCLILMDCSMPLLDGFEACRRIRLAYYSMDVVREHQPMIIGITGHVEPEYFKKALKHGMDEVLPKPLPIYRFG